MPSDSPGSGAEAVVIDASVAIKAALVDGGFQALGDRRLLAPTLLWSESASGLSQLAWRQEISTAEVDAALRRLAEASIEAISSRELVAAAAEIARRLGWAKTYDAEYVALARDRDITLVTLDARLRRTADLLVSVVGPTELPGRPRR